MYASVGLPIDSFEFYLLKLQRNTLKLLEAYCTVKGKTICMLSADRRIPKACLRKRLAYTCPVYSKLTNQASHSSTGSEEMMVKEMKIALFCHTPLHTQTWND